MRMLTKESTIETWTKLLPNVKDTEELNNYIEEYWGCTLDEVLENYDSEADSQTELIENLITENTAADHSTAYDAMFSAVTDRYTWNEFFRPLLRNAGEQIIEMVESCSIIENKELLCEDTFTALYTQCYDIAFRVILQEFGYTKKEDKLSGENETEMQEQFNEMLKDPEFLTGVYNNYPELIRLLDVRCRWFVNMARELICGTEKEIENIRTKINSNVRTIKQISFSEGDSHREGRMVCIMTFNDDIKIVYKPRSLETEDAFNEVIDYFNKKGGPEFQELKLFKYHTTDKQGWTEFINFEPCDNEGEVHDYYKKMGELLGIIYMLNGKDFHSENIICSKADPILIDLETLLHSIVFETGAKIEGACDEAIDIIDRSVMKTGFLPMQIVNPNTKKKLEVGAMGRQREQESPFRSVSPVRGEDGEIKLEKVFGTMESHSCCPVLNGEKQDAVKFIEDIMDGFEMTYKLVCGDKQAFVKCITDAFTEKMNRVIVRSTNIYDQIVRTSYHPLLFRNAWDRKMFLLKIIAVTERSRMCKGLVCSELRDMYNGDIPYFMCTSEGTELIDSEVLATGQMFDKSLLSSAVDTILSMNDIDMKRQLGFISLSFAEELEEEGTTADKVNIKRSSCPEEVKNKTFTKEDYLERILQITEEKSVQRPGHEVSNIIWLNINRSPDWPTFVSYMRTDIYGGLSGMYLYLMAHSRATGNKKALEFAKRIETELEYNLEKVLANDDVDLSGFVGASGIVYSFAREGADKAKVASIYRALVKNVKVSKMPQTDFLSGVAGLMKLLIYVYKKLDGFDGFSNEDKELAKARIRECADELIARATYENENALYWGVEGYTGYAHGVAGIVDAFADYYEFSNDERVIDIIEKGCAYVESCRVIEDNRNNWARDKERNSVSINWCHGAPGIALMKMRLAEVFGDKFVTRSDLEEIAGIIRDNGYGVDHCLCHGDMGNLMVLKRLAKVLGNKELQEFCMEQYRIAVEGMKEKVFGDYFYYSEDTSFMLGPQALAVGILDMEYNENMLDILTLR